MRSQWSFVVLVSCLSLYASFLSSTFCSLLPPKWLINANDRSCSHNWVVWRMEMHFQLAITAVNRSARATHQRFQCWLPGRGPEVASSARAAVPSSSCCSEYSSVPVGSLANADEEVVAFHSCGWTHHPWPVAEQQQQPNHLVSVVLCVLNYLFVSWIRSIRSLFCVYLCSNSG